MAAPAIGRGLLSWRMVTAWPRNLPGLGTGAARLAQRITAMSEGRLTVSLHAAGELVSGLQCFDAVADGTVEMGHDAAYYHLAKHRQTAFFTAIPFGLTASETAAWIHHGGGQQLWDELYAGFNLKPFLAGDTGTQALGWYRRELKTATDYRGLKVRMPGLGGEVVRRLGATVVVVGGDVQSALASGEIDAAEWIGPYNDLAAGFHEAAKLYYGPGFHEPGTALELIVNRARWLALDPDLQQIVAVAAQASHADILAEYTMRNGTALELLRTIYGVQYGPAPRDLLIALATASTELLAEDRDKADELGRRIFGSYLAARRDLMAGNRFGELSYLQARNYPFRFLE